MIREFDIVEDFPMMTKWLKAHSIPVPYPQDMPKLGFVASDIAIGFLILNNSSQCAIESVITNPTSEKEERDKALMELFKHIETEASRYGYKVITALANMPVMKDRFTRLKYESHGAYTLYYKHLGGE